MSNGKRIAGRINCVLVAGGVWHDIDYARLELLRLLAEDERFRVRVFENYENLEAIAEADLLISYTCNVVPSLESQELLKSWVESGGRWYALHGTNSIIRMMSDGKFGTPNLAPLFIETLGSMFHAHPPIEAYRVEVADPLHPLVKGIEPFEVTDELYLMSTNADVKVLLDTEFGGVAESFVDNKWSHSRHPVFYLHGLGAGAVLYLTLGHCRHHLDMQPIMDYWPSLDRCAWENPIYYKLLRRGINWAIEPFDAETRAALNDRRSAEKSKTAV